VTSCNHTGIALKALIMFSAPRKILFAFMFLTWFLSAWLQNTAVAALMVPMLTSVLTRLQSDTRGMANSQNQNQSRNVTTSVELEDNDVDEEKTITVEKDDVKNSVDNGDEQLSLVDKYSTACLIGVAYSASLGGISTPG
jgi:di/tricarboxylate transporter